MLWDAVGIDCGNKRFWGEPVRKRPSKSSPATCVLLRNADDLFPMVTLAEPTSCRRWQPHPRAARILRAQLWLGTSSPACDLSSPAVPALQDSSFWAIVEITGPPCVIIGNTPADHNNFHQPCLSATTQYAARVTGGSGSYTRQ